MTKDDLAECKGCESLGQCCWMSVQISNHVDGHEMRLYSRVPCHKLDVRTGLCTDYENRLEVPWCRQSTPDDPLHWPHFCAHHQEAGPLMVMAGKYHQLNAKPGRRTAHDRETFMKKIDQLVITEVEQQYGIKLKAEIGKDYKNRQKLRKLEQRNRGAGRGSRDPRGHK